MYRFVSIKMLAFDFNVETPQLVAFKMDDKCLCYITFLISNSVSNRTFGLDVFFDAQFVRSEDVTVKVLILLMKLGLQRVQVKNHLDCQITHLK